MAAAEICFNKCEFGLLVVLQWLHSLYCSSVIIWVIKFAILVGCAACLSMSEMTECLGRSRRIAQRTKEILHKRAEGVQFRIGSNWLKIDPMEGFCDHGNEYSGFIKDWKFHKKLGDFSPSELLFRAGNLSVREVLTNGLCLVSFCDFRQILQMYTTMVSKIRFCLTFCTINYYFRKVVK